MYRIEYTPLAIKKLKEIDQYTRALLIGWIEKNLVGCDNPKRFGKNLQLNQMEQEQWQYRIGDYRFLAVIQDDRIIILTVTSGYSKNE